MKLKTTKLNWAAATTAVLMVAFVAPLAQADSIGEVEGARLKQRSGHYITPGDREQLRRYGGREHGWRGGYDPYYYDDYGYGGGVSVYVGPRRYGGYGY